jgi:hypothetical protein
MTTHGTHHTHGHARVTRVHLVQSTAKTTRNTHASIDACVVRGAWATRAASLGDATIGFRSSARHPAGGQPEE